MYVYFMKTVSTDKQGSIYLYKIGHASDVARRLKQLQTGCPVPIALFGTLKCSNKIEAASVERDLHEYYANKRRSGEWFQFSVRDAWTISVLMKDWPIKSEIKDYMPLAFKMAQRMKDVIYGAGIPVWNKLDAIETLNRNELIDRVSLLPDNAFGRH